MKIAPPLPLIAALFSNEQLSMCKMYVSLINSLSSIIKSAKSAICMHDPSPV